MYPAFEPPIGAFNGSGDKKVTFIEFNDTNSLDRSKNFDRPANNSKSISVSSSLVTTETPLYNNKNRTREKLEERKNINNNIKNYSLNNKSIALKKNSSVLLYSPKNSSLINSSSSFSMPFNNFLPFYQSSQMNNFSFPSMKYPQKFFFHRALFPPYVYEPNIMLAFTQRVFNFVSNIMRPFAMI